MKYFNKICEGIDVAPLLAEIESQPLLWDSRRERTGFEGSPFAGTSDIWLRYREPSELKEGKDFKEPHFSVNYPAWYSLPAAQAIVFGLMYAVRGVHLGGVLLTRIKPGGRILPHHDQGSWHAEQMNCKVYIPIKANDHCVNYCGDESLVIRKGEAVEFNNLIVHSVENNGDCDRITLIVCMRRDP